MTQTTNGQRATDDLARLAVMAKELESYIVAGEVYRTVLTSTASGNHKITMSGGDLLARRNRLREQYQTLTKEQQAQFDQVTGQIQSAIYSLRTRFHDLLRRELKARNDQLAWNVEVRRNREEDQADPAEVHNREQMAAIQNELNSLA